MFQSIEYIGLGQQVLFAYRITDSDIIINFESNGGLGVAANDLRQAQLASICGQCIATEYEKRNLNVAANIVRYYKWVMGRTNLRLEKIVLVSRNYSSKQSEEFYSKYLKFLCRNLI